MKTPSPLIMWMYVAGCFLSISGGRTGSAAENAIRHVHDPCIIKDGAYYSLFSTGPGVPIRRSKNLLQWEFIGHVFQEKVPEWARKELPQSDSLWAPDIAFFNGRFHLYYSVSTFGRNRSMIGMASNRTLDPQSPDYRWLDEGKVVESFPHHDFNAIDPNLVIDRSGRMSLSFGSFWSGLKLVALDTKTGKPPPDARLHSIARRPFPGAVEAPFIIQREGIFYLFVSFDACCKGVESTYNIRVGRAKRVEGPYLDRQGHSLLEGGGTLLLGTEGRFVGPGHNAVLRDPTGDFLVYHAYDRNHNGVPTLQIRPLHWERSGWPAVGDPFNLEAVQPGDVNADDKVDITDGISALRYAVGLETPTAEQLKRTDLMPLAAHDGRVSISDAVQIMRLTVGME